MLTGWEAALPSGQYRAVAALVGDGWRTYSAAAKRAGLSVNSLKTHLRWVRRWHPDLWKEIARCRAAQRAERHDAAVRRVYEHSRDWHRKQFFRAYGYWPRERRREGM